MACSFRLDASPGDLQKVRKEWHAEKDGNQPFLTSEDVELRMAAETDKSEEDEGDESDVT